jgi:FdrA protein
MLLVSRVFANTYRDSYVLMRIASLIRKMAGVTNAEVMMATEPNKGVLSQTRLLTDEVAHAGPNDLVICVMAECEKTAWSAIEEAEEMLMQGMLGKETHRVARSINHALALLPQANLALISIPGPHVKREAIRALKKGLNIMIFSDNVSREDEILIKKMAAEQRLLVMGPDCGTAIINGVALGFANDVRHGSIGLVGASGTGLQEVSVLIHHAGAGISHVIGTGSNDVSDQVGGVTMLHGIKLLEADPTTDIVVIVSKLPGSRTLAKILRELKGCSKPVVANFLGQYSESFSDGNVFYTLTLEETAVRAVGQIDQTNEIQSMGVEDGDSMLKTMELERRKLADHQKYVRGLFSGGTLATEACVIMLRMLPALRGNISLRGVAKLDDPNKSNGHCIIDLGADEFTLGKPHPMLEPEMRRDRLLVEAQDPEVAVLLLDFVLGYGVHPDPADATIPTIAMAKKIAEEDGRHLPIVASVCGTEEDPQNKTAQVDKLEKHGVIVLSTNAQAARFAGLIAAKS